MSAAVEAAPVDRTTDYAEAVVEGRVVAGRLVQLACERHLRDLDEGPARGLAWDVPAAEHAMAFFPRFLTHWKGKFAGQPFELEPFQCFCIGSLWGWRMADTGLRRFRMALEELARKNGKTTKAAGVALLLAFADNEPGAEVYSAATKRDQAKICHEAAKRMVLASPSLRRRIKDYRHSLVRADNHSVFEALGRDSNTMDGLNVSGAVIDELHKHKDRTVVEVLETGTGSRTQPLIFMITTAGSSKETVCGEYHDYAVAVLQGGIEDDSFFAFISSIDVGDGETEGDDWTDPACWPKANPSLGVSVDLDDLIRKRDKAIKQPAWRNAFMRLHLNVWTSQEDRWLPMDDYDLCRGQVGWAELPELLRGELCYGGLDLSSRKDFTGWVLVFPPNPDRAAPLEPGAWYVVPRSWIPQKRMDLRANELKQPVEAWHAIGALDSTPGGTIQYDVVKSQILADAEAFDLQQVGFDPYMAEQIAMQLGEEGLTMVPVRQGMLSLSAPSKELEAQLIDHACRHGGHPVMRWMAEKVAAKIDDADNVKPSKRTSGDRIDIIVAWICALHRAIAGIEDDTSIYASQPMLVLGG